MNALELNHKNTYATPDELIWLTAQAGQLPLWADVVMIGAGPGVMALALIEGRPQIKLTVIDKTSTEYVKAHIEQFDFSYTGITYVISDSAYFGTQWTGPKLDFLIIDGDHTYAGVKRDLDAWTAHVKPNGLIFLHDYDAEGTCFSGVERYPGVKEAVEECSAQWEEYARVGTAIVMKVLE